MGFRSRSHHHHLPCAQQRFEGGLSVHSTPFTPIRTPTTPLHARANRRWSSSPFDPRLCLYHLPCVQVRAGGEFFIALRHHSGHHHLLACKCKPEVGPYSILMLFAPSPPPLRARASWGWIFYYFDAVHAVSTSLACKSEPEVYVCMVSTRSRLLHPPCMQERARGGFLWNFQCRSHPLRLPRMQERVGGGFLQGFNLFAPASPPSRANVSWGWFLWGFDAVRALSTSLACKSKPEVDFCWVLTRSCLLHPLGVIRRPVLWSFYPIRTATASPVSKSEHEVSFMAISTPFMPASTSLASKSELEVGF